MSTTIVITLLIILTSVGVVAYIYMYNKNKFLKTKLAEEQQAHSKDCRRLNEMQNQFSLSQQSLHQDIETKQTEVDCLKMQIQQLDADNSRNINEINELRKKIDLRKSKLVDMTKHIQMLGRTMMTDAGQVKSMFSDFFVLHKPWDTLGGDFYKFIKKGDHTLVACGNCGHSGIGGSIKGLLNIVFIQEILQRGNLDTMVAGNFLDQIRSKYAHLAEKNDQYRTDEDIPVNFSVCIVNEKERLMTYAGAYGSMCLVRKSYPGTARKENDLHEFRGDKMNFAVSFGRRKNYNTEFINLEKDDRIYLKTDGYANQRGGSNNDRYGDSYLRQLIMKNANLPMIEQKRAFEEEFTNWKGQNTKGNDILIIGLALKVAGK